MTRCFLRYSCVIAFTLSTVVHFSFAQTITSKSSGGAWTDVNTWIGGVVPTQNNDVVIEGTVSTTAAAVCRNLTVNGTLDAISWPAANLSVTGNLVNNGLIKDYEAYYWNTLSITITGHLTNNGIIRNGRTYFKGTAEHRLSLGSGKIFETTFASLDTLGTFTALSPLHFKGAFNLKGAALNMQSYGLTLEGNGSPSNGSVTNTADLTGKSGSALNNITYKGAANLKSIVIVGSNVTFEGTLTVTDTLQAISWPASSCTVAGNLVINGLVRDYEAYYWNTLTLYVTGNLTNNGIIRNGRTYFKGAADHKIALGAGRMFQTKFGATDTLSSFTAQTPLYFLDYFDLKGGTLNMQAYALTLDGPGNTTYGTISNTGDIIGKSGATLSNAAYKGTVTLKSIVLVSKNVSFEGTLTVKDTLEVTSSDYVPAVTVKGDIINNGLIRNYEGYYWKALYLYISGNLTNNGIWRNTKTYLNGKKLQTLTLAAGKYFETSLAEQDTLQSVKAASALHFKAPFDLKGGTLDLQSYALTLDGAGNIAFGTVMNTADIYGKNYAEMSNITYRGTITLHTIIIAGTNVTFDGALTVKDTLQVSGSQNVPAVTVKGNMVNNGLVRNYEAYYWKSLNLYITGNYTNNGWIRNTNTFITGALLNNGTISAPGYPQNMNVSGDITSLVKWETGTLFLTGNGERTIQGAGITCAIRSAGEKVMITGNSWLNNLTVDAKSVCIVASGASVLVPENNLDETIDNHGMIATKKKLGGAGEYPFFHSRVRVLANHGIDSVRVESMGTQVPESFANAVKCYWRVATYSKNPVKSFTSMTFMYDHELLGGSIESALQVFNSQDSGKTWVQLSTSQNMTRDAANNTITLADAPSNGDYLLSSSADPVSVRPCIITAIISRSGIRIGAPSRVTIHFVNNSDLAVDDFLLSVNTGSQIHISGAEIPLADGGKLVLPKDSLFYDVHEDTTVFFYVLKMGAREERSFDIIVYGNVPATRMASLDKAAFIDPVSITAGAVITWAAWKAGTFVVTKAIDYIGDKTVENVKLTPAEQQRYDQMVRGGIPTELEQQPGKAKVFAVKFVGGMAAKKLLDLAPAGSSALQIAATTTANVKKVAPSLRQRIFNWLYKESGLYGVEETQSGNSYQPAVSTATQKKGVLVRAWDPNEKVGPEGFGDKKFITSAGKMMYQILFENKKEATAPAYKIVIVDTLRAEFDPETVEFGRTSHDAAQYVWKKTRTGNILKWEIEGIELPPNVNAPEGEGWVAFTVSPKPGLASGTSLENAATIVFDMNPALRTNTYVNTLDFKAPVSTMKALSPSVSGKQMLVKWSSVDEANGSGVESTTLYAAIDDGAYAVVGTTNADSLVIPIQAGSHKYSFYALAKDFLGNVESVRPAIVTTQTVNAVERIEQQTPHEFALAQNYPNPFNPSTTIQFSLPVSTRTELKIYDALGRTVATLVNEEMPAGRYSVQWNAGGFASGMYIYRLTAGTFVQTRKLMLVK
ncbi:MAG TPA: T9SS type A sorting domain-containing protein [Bacteroidota bacterium]|nr:T9SS type A sorting domain-containing protein [Bacteroidota bacterium]